MEIIESIAWAGVGFVPTLIILDLVTRKSYKETGVHLLRGIDRIRAGAEA